MEITGLKTSVVKIPFAEEESLIAWAGLVFGRKGSFIDHIIVEINTDEGITGLGDVVGAPVSAYDGITTEGIVSAINNHMGPALIGEDPFNRKKIFEKLHRAYFKLGPSNYPHACINMAIHDVIGKKLGVPTYKLLGGKYRDRVPLMWCVGFKGKDAFREAIRRKYEKGFRAFKVKGDGDFEKDIERIAIAREIAPDAIIWPDFNELYTPKNAIKIIREMEKYDIFCCEQPVDIHDFTGLAKVAAAVDVPITPDEGIRDVEDLIHHIEYKAADMASLKIEESGGLDNTQLMAEIAEAHNIPCLLASMGSTGIGVAAGAHLVTATKNILYSELAWPLYHADDIIHTDIEWYKQIENGSLFAPELPGLGIEIDVQKFEKYKVHSIDTLPKI